MASELPTRVIPPADAASLLMHTTAPGDDVVAALIRLADTLVEDFDVLEVLDELARDCVRLLGVTAAGILLAAPAGPLTVVAASSEDSRLLELAQLQRDQGPCLDCYRAGEPVSADDLSTNGKRWPSFTEAALATGYQSVHALPMRLRKQVIGTLNLFSVKRGGLSAAAERLGRALADMATITILQDRAMRASEDLAAHLQLALGSRVVLEQAKGVLAQYGQIEMDDAFGALRRFSRNNNRRIQDVAQAVVGGSIELTTVLAARPTSHAPDSGREP